MEVWKRVPGYGDYEVSNLGRVMSFRKKLPYIMKCNLKKSNYYRYSLRNNDGKRTFGVHVIVAMSFLGHKPCGNKYVVDHINDNKLDNRLCNLQVITHRENICKTQVGFTSNYKGVYWHSGTKKWASSIYINGKKISLGFYEDEYEAHLAYQNALNNLND